MNDAGGSAREGPSALADDRAAERLVGAAVPALRLESTGGPVDLADLATGLLVLFVYPHATGLPDSPVSGWDLIPGARGCTAQACAFRDHHDRLSGLGAEVAGLSVQTVEEQRAFAFRVGLHYRLISDPTRQAADALGLPTFTADGRTFYRRLTLIGTSGRVVKVFGPILAPEANAEEVATWLETGRDV
jgi:peroxiredoxin